MDINDLRGLSTVFVMIAFLGVCWWAFSPKHKKRFEEDAMMPFADDDTEIDNSVSRDRDESRQD